MSLALALITPVTSPRLSSMASDAPSVTLPSMVPVLVSVLDASGHRHVAHDRARVRNVFVAPVPVNLTAPSISPVLVNTSPPARSVIAPSIPPALLILSPDPPMEMEPVIVPACALVRLLPAPLRESTTPPGPGAIVPAPGILDVDGGHRIEPAVNCS